ERRRRQQLAGEGNLERQSAVRGPCRQSRQQQDIAGEGAEQRDDSGRGVIGEFHGDDDVGQQDVRDDNGVLRRGGGKKTRQKRRDDQGVVRRGREKSHADGRAKVKFCQAAGRLSESQLEAARAQPFLQAVHFVLGQRRQRRAHRRAGNLAQEPCAILVANVKV